MLRFGMITMIKEDDRRRTVFTVLNQGKVSIREAEILGNTCVGSYTMYDCDPEIIANMIQDKHNNGYTIVDYK